jgi:CRP-like cAMP-binding protein
MVFDEGETAHSLFEIVEGSVMMFNTLEDGRRQITALLGSGAIFGFSPTELYANSVQSLEPVRLLPHDLRAAEHCPTFRTAVLRTLSAQICDLRRTVVMLGQMTAKEKIATFLMSMLGPKDCTTCADRGKRRRTPVPILLRRYEIGDLLGLTPETVSRVFCMLRRSQVIEYGKKDDVTIVDICSLCAFSK